MSRRIDPAKLSEPFQTALGYYEAYRRLGFLPDDIHLFINGPLAEPAEMAGKVQILLTLAAQGKTFHAHCGVLEAEPKDVLKTWGKIGRAIRKRKIDEAALQKLWRRSVPYHDAFGFVWALKVRGFLLPRELN